MTTIPRKPYRDFPLWIHRGQMLWCKKIRGEHKYFGPVSDVGDFGAFDALARYQKVAEALHAGRTPRIKGDGLTIADLANRFLTAKGRARDAGEITEATFENYYKCCARVVGFFGKGRLVEDLAADDFEGFRAEMASGLAPASLAHQITMVRVVFKYAHDLGLIEQPVRYGRAFDKPSKRVLRKYRAEQPAKMFEAAELRKILDAADQPMQAMIYLGVNAAFGPNDVGTLPKSAVNLNTGWLDFPRPKSGIERHVPLWPETVASIRASLAVRPASRRREVFLTPFGEPWVSRSGKRNLLGYHFLKLLRSLGLHVQGRAFYSFRHVFRTVADETLDFPAVNAIMGHTDPTMGGVYRQRIDDSRLLRVTEHVRGWLFRRKV